ncbi:RusA family crossover junction endodeoxyribonuclease [Salimicrobium jeotgali]|uniref:RusA family crossover junction endodeoxyribonuclease n=1 Tax=Salimicrobium jeotgali TaxID=1230341 RepID=UPI000C8403B3|nr:RusA family crossover junction endodeoxyribonuclease [Salimicrobium jeotgali]
MIEFTVPGSPVAQGRPRAGKNRYGKTVMYDPAASRNYKKQVQLIARQHAPKKLLEGPLEVFIKVYRPIPKSFSKKRAAEAEDGIVRPVTKSDIDNYAKSVMDAVNATIYRDDAQIVTLTAEKHYSETPRVEVQVTELEVG